MLNLLSICECTVKRKAYRPNVIFLILFSYECSLKNVLFCLNSIVEQYNVIAKLGTFFMSHPVLLSPCRRGLYAVVDVNLFVCLLVCSSVV